MDEDVLAFSHGSGGDTAIVVFNNQPAPVRGVLQLDRNLGISAAADRTCAFRDRLSERHFLRSAATINDLGLELELAGYESAVLVDFRELDDDQGTYQRLCRHLGLSGTPSLEETGREIHLEDARAAFGDVLATLSVAAPVSASAVLAVEGELEKLDRQLRRAIESVPAAGGSEAAGSLEPQDPGGLDQWLEAVSRLAAVEQALGWPRTERMLGALERLLVSSTKEATARFVLPAFALLGYLHRRWGSRALAELEPGWTARQVLKKRGVSEERAHELAALVELASTEHWLETAPPPGCAEASKLLTSARDSEIARSLLGYDRGTDTVSRERLDSFLAWRATAAALSWLATQSVPDPSVLPGEPNAEAVVGWCDVLERLRGAIVDAEFQIEPVLARLRTD